MLRSVVVTTVRGAVDERSREGGRREKDTGPIIGKVIDHPGYYFRIDFSFFFVFYFFFFSSILDLIRSSPFWASDMYSAKSGTDIVFLFTEI